MREDELRRMGWSPVDGFRDLPRGMWYVVEDHPTKGLRQHVADVCKGAGNSTIHIIGGVFGWDRGKIIAYRPVHELPESPES